MVRTHNSRATEGREREVTKTESEQAPTGWTMEDRSGGIAGQGTPLQDKREDGEMSSEEGETSMGRREESPKDNETVEKAPRPTVADSAEEDIYFLQECHLPYSLGRAELIESWDGHCFWSGSNTNKHTGVVILLGSRNVEIQETQEMVPG
ncbi:unnamed protein product [Lampetra planeri]